MTLRDTHATAVHTGECVRGEMRTIQRARQLRGPPALSLDERGRAERTNLRRTHTTLSDCTLIALFTVSLCGIHCGGAQCVSLSREKLFSIVFLCGLYKLCYVLRFRQCKARPFTRMTESTLALRGLCSSLLFDLWLELRRLPQILFYASGAYGDFQKSESAPKG